MKTYTHKGEAVIRFRPIIPYLLYIANTKISPKANMWSIAITPLFSISFHYGSSAVRKYFKNN